MSIKRALALLTAPLLALSCLSLVACGSNQAPQQQQQQTEAAATTTAVDPTQKFIGTFKLAAAEYGDITLSGDMSTFLEQSNSSTLEIKADNTGSVAFAGSTVPFDWKLKDDNTLDATLKGDSAASTGTITYADDALKFVMSADGESMTLYFTTDGTYAKAKTISMDQGTAVTSESELVGTWKIVGASYNGASAYGTSEALAKAGMGQIATVTFEAGGKVTIDDTEGTYAVDANGATITTTGGTALTIPIKKLGDELMIDGSGIVQGINVVILLSK